MAIPAMQANSNGSGTSLGSIAWDAFTVRYTPDPAIPAVAYPVAAGTTTKRFVWWRYNSGTPVIEAGDYLPDGLSGTIVPNSSFDQQDGIDTTMAAGWKRGGWPTDNGFGTAKLSYAQGSRSMELFNDATGNGVSISPEDAIAVTPGETLHLAVDVRGSVATSGLYLRLARADTGAEINGTVEGRSITTSWVRQTGTVVVPAGVFSVRPFALAYASSTGTTAKVYIKNLTVSRAPLPAGLNPDDLFLFINKNGVPVNVQLASVIDGSLIVNESILADSIGANQITSTKIIAGAIDATHIQAGTIESVHIKSGSISTKSLMIGSFDNLFADPTFATPLSNGGAWSIATGWSKSIGTARDGGETLRVATSGGDRFLVNDPLNYYPIDTVDTSGKANVSYFASVIAKSSAANTAGGVVVGARWALANGSVTTTYVGDDQTGAAGAWTRYSGMLSAPPTAIGVQFFIGVRSVLNGGTVDFDYVGANRAGTGELIVDGTIKGQHIEAGTINATHLSVGTLSAGFTLTGAIQIGEIGVLNPITISGTDGLRLPQPDGGEIHFPVDGTSARVTADFTATSLNVKDDLTINGFGQINGNVDLAQGVSAPSTLVGISQEWPSVWVDSLNGDHDPTLDVGQTFNGLTDHHSNPDFVCTAVNYFGAGIRVFSKTDPGYVAYYPDPTSGKAWCSNFYAWGGIARLGTDYYVLGSDNTRSGVYIYRISGTTWDKTAELKIGPINTFPKDPCLVADAANSRVGMIWHAGSNLYLRWHSANLVTVGANVALTANTAGTTSYEMGDAHLGDAGTGTTQLYISYKDISVVQGYSNPATGYAATPAPTRASGYDFPRADNLTVAGMTWDAAQGRMISFDKNGRKRTYSKFATGVPDIRAAYTYYDGDNGNYPAGTIINGVDKSGTASGAHETLPSSTKTYGMSRRAWPVFEMSPAPDVGITDASRVDKANRIGFYWGNGSVPLRYAYLPVGQRIVRGLDSVPTSGTLPTMNGFGTAAAAPGGMRSAAVYDDLRPKIELFGDGSGRLGPMAWTKDTNLVSTHQEAICSTAAALTTSAVAMSGLALTVNSRGPGDVFQVMLTADMSYVALNGAAAGTSGTGVATLWINGAQYTGTGGAASAIFGGTAVGQRATTFQQYRVTGLAKGNHTFTVTALRIGTPGIQFFNAHSKLSVQRSI